MALRAGARRVNLGGSMLILLRRLAFMIGLIGAVIGAQAPEFAQQYRQRLAGAVDELARIVAVFDKEAAAQGLAPEAAITRLEANADPLAAARGRDIAEDKARLARLQAALTAIAEGSIWRRAWGAVEGMDGEIAARAWADFQPAVPTNADGFLAGGLGLVVAWAAAHLGLWPVRRRVGRRA